VVPDLGHWIVEENPKATIVLVRVPVKRANSFARLALQRFATKLKAPGAHLIASVTFIAVLMTILIQAPTTKWLAARLNLLEHN
jgi:NhaP-type Na+/H+ or K+/H+ antiporter